MREHLLRPEDPPSPEHVVSFARTCILFAHRHGRLRKRKGAYTIGPMARYTPPDITMGEPFGFLYEDTFRVHATMDVPHDEASLEIIHTIAAREISAAVGATGAVAASELRTHDVFKVSAGSTVESNRRLEQTIGGVKYARDTVFLDDINLDAVHIPDDIAGRISIEDNFRMLSEADFASVTRDISDRMSMVDESGCEFSETRKNYLSYFDT